MINKMELNSENRIILLINDKLANDCLLSAMRIDHLTVVILGLSRPFSLDGSIIFKGVNGS